MSDLNYPDNLYADHLASQEPTGAYRAPPETDTVEDALRAACIALSNATDRLRAAQSAYLRDRGQPAPPTAKQSYDAQTARDVAWSAERGDYTLPWWHPDYGKPRHPMSAEADRLIGPEDVL